MGKQGPCYHCGVTSTPLWRNGPPEKPVLCNACGSRWRTKGSLTNYTPLHSRAEADEYEDHRVSKVKTISRRIGDEKLKKRKLSYENSVGKRFASEYNQGFLESIDEDTSNRSSSDSAGSYSNSFVQVSSADASDLTGSAQSAVWETQVPSKKRTSMTRMKSSSPVEKLIKDLHAILQEQQSSYVSGSSEDDLLFESDVPTVSVEIGHGSVLIKHPSSFIREEDSEASSLSFENKPCEIMQQNPAKRDQLNHDRMQHFLTRNSPLCYIDVNDIINFEVLMSHFTSEEQKQLINYLPPDDTTELPGSLENMFDSSCFKENVSYFQQLLSDGVFSSRAEMEDFKTLSKLAVSNLTRSRWLELNTKLKDRKSPNGTQEIEVESGSKLGLAKYLHSAKMPLQEQNLSMPVKETNEGPKRGLDKSGPGSKETFCLGKLLHLSTDICHYECSDEDLLLDMPLNGSFPEAELLLPPSNITSHQTSTSCSSIHSDMIPH